MKNTELETWEKEIWELLNKNRQSLNEDQQSLDEDQQSLEEDPDTTSYDEFKQKFLKAMKETIQLEIRKYYAGQNFCFSVFIVTTLYITTAKKKSPL